MKNIPSIGIQIADILLPNESIDPGKWAVIACDQFTSEPEYWQAVEKHVGDSPSTLNLILPEVYLEKEESKDRAQDNPAGHAGISGCRLARIPSGFHPCAPHRRRQNPPRTDARPGSGTLRLQQRLAEPDPRHRRHHRRSPAARA